MRQAITLTLPFMMQPITNGENGEPKEIEVSDISGLCVRLQGVGETGRGKEIGVSGETRYEIDGSNIVLHIASLDGYGYAKAIVSGKYGQVCLRAEVSLLSDTEGETSFSLPAYVFKVVDNSTAAATIVAESVEDLKRAIAELPDGQAVSVKVAEHTVALSKLHILTVDELDTLGNYCTSLADLSEKYSLINLTWTGESGTVVCASILPSTDSEHGWLYEFQEGWRVCKMNAYEFYPENDFLDLASYMDGHSSRLATKEEIGERANLITEAKSNIVAAVNEVSGKVTDLSEKVDSLIGGETRVDFNLDDYVIDFRIVTTNLVWYKEEGAGALIPVSEYKGKVVTIVNNNSNLGRFSPLKDNKASNQTPPSFCDGFDFLTDSPIEIGETKSITIPQDCNYLYIYKSYRGADRAPEAVYTTKAGGGRVTVLESEMAQAKNDIASNAEKIDGVVGEGIFSTLPKLEFLPKMQAAKKRYYSSTNTTQKLPIVLAHISDIHGNFANVSRFLQFCDEYASYIDMKVNTGDLVLANWADDTSGYFEKEGANSIVNIIGNHDTRDEASTNWRKYVGVQAYNRYIAPAISSWGVTQPEGAAANGLCYYYKDYADNLLRIIFVDVMGYDDAQNTWLQGILADANTNGLHVMIVAHLTSFSTSAEAENAPFIKVDCNYSTKGGLLSSSTTSNNYNANAYKMLASVDAFMTAGGTFIGYLQGHAHYDFIARISKYPSQMVYAIGATKAGEMRDYNHIVGTRNQDEFQIVSIDTYLHKVVLYKVGANTDLYGREKNAVCIDYTTGNVIADH